jgi:uncharacterized protein YbjT (DUF2867 family)
MSSGKKIFVTGAGGFIGREICKGLLDSGYEVTALIRPSSRISSAITDSDRFHIHRGDVTVAKSFADAMKGHDAVIHLVGIIREFPERKITFQGIHAEATFNVVRNAVACGVKRYLHMSALGASRASTNMYHSTKWMAEEAVRASALDFTIYRPSIVYGRFDEFTNMIADMLKRQHVFPLIGGGKTRLQPVAVKDVADGFVNAIDKIQSFGKTYEIGGPQQLTFSEIVRTIMKVSGTWAITPYASTSLMKFLARRMEKYKWFPLTQNQLELLLEDNITEDKMYFQDFEIAPIPFAEGIKKYLGKR